MTFKIHLELNEFDELIGEYLKAKGFSVLDIQYLVSDNRLYEAVAKVEPIEEEDQNYVYPTGL